VGRKKTPREHSRFEELLRGTGKGCYALKNGLGDEQRAETRALSEGLVKGRELLKDIAWTKRRDTGKIAQPKVEGQSNKGKTPTRGSNLR